MATVALTADTFHATIKGPGIVLVDFGASWCEPCRLFAPVYEAASQAHPDMTFGTVDVDVEPAVADSAAIKAVPTLMAFRDGLVLWAQQSGLNATTLDRIIAAVADLDMNDVRAKVAAVVSS